MSNIRNIEAEIDAMIEEDDEFNGVDTSNLEDDDNGEDNQGEEQGQVQSPGEDDKTLEARGTPEGGEAAKETPVKKAGADLVDAKGNVVDKDGKIIARAGSERRLHVEKRQAEAKATNLGLQLQEANQRLQQAQVFADLPKSLGISPEEYGDALQLTKLFKSDPVAAAKEVVARVMAMGHNVTDILGAEVGNSVDMMALRRHSEEMAARPAREKAEQDRQVEERQRQGLIAYNNFIAQYPDSEPHEDAIANLMGQNGISAEVAYLQIKNFAMANGLDFEQPLGPQIAAKAEAHMRGQARNDQPPAGNRRAPMGNGTGGRVQDQSLTNREQMGNASDSWAELVRSAMEG